MSFFTDPASAAERSESERVKVNVLNIRHGNLSYISKLMTVMEVKEMYIYYSLRGQLDPSAVIPNVSVMVNIMLLLVF